MDEDFDLADFLDKLDYFHDDLEEVESAPREVRVHVVATLDEK